MDAEVTTDHFKVLGGLKVSKKKIIQDRWVMQWVSNQEASK